METLEAQTGSTLRLGTVAIGSGFASGAIDVAEKGTFGEDVTIEVTVDPNVVLADALLALDTGKSLFFDHRAPETVDWFADLSVKRRQLL